MELATKCLYIYFDCRVEGSSVIFDELRNIFREEFEQLLALAHLHGLGGERFRTALFFIHASGLHLEIQVVPAEVSESYNYLQRAAEHLEALATVQPSILLPEQSSQFQNRLVDVTTSLRELFEGRTDNWLAFVVTTYANVMDVTYVFQELQAQASPTRRVVGLRIDGAFARVTQYDRGHNRLYNCGADAAQMRSVIHETLRTFLLPNVVPLVRLNLQLGSELLPCRATVRHCCAALWRCCRVEDFRTQPAVQPGTYMAGRRLQICSTERHRYDALSPHFVAARPPVLRLEAVLQPQDVDEASLFGDTWVLEPDTPPTPLLSPGEAALLSSWENVCAVFGGVALLLSGDHHGIVSHCHVALKRHHFVAYVKDGGMRVREVVPTELLVLPIAPPTRHQAVVDAAQRAALEVVRQTYEERARNWTTSMGNGLCGGVSALAAHVRLNTEFELNLRARNLPPRQAESRTTICFDPYFG